MTGGGSPTRRSSTRSGASSGSTSPTRPWTSTTITQRLADDPPAIWSLGWIADYPGRNDFLGVLLGTDSTNDYGHWSSATSSTPRSPRLARRPIRRRPTAAYDRAEAILDQRTCRSSPSSYGTGWALSRDGLLGAGQNGLGIVRMAGLAWAD